MLRGNTEQQVKQIRDYLARMVRSLSAAENSSAASVSQNGRARPGGTSSGSQVDQATAETIRATAARLKALIVKTSEDLGTQISGEVNGVYAHMDSVESSLSSIYLARSDFGEYTETVQSTIEQTAKRTVESYDYQAQIDAVNARYGDMDSYVTAIRGEIRRGIITDPETGEEQMGIAISENLSFTGATRTENGQVYYELSPGQTLGLYTAKGWQFWINGSKKGWFDSADGMLHTANMVVENDLQLGDSWQQSTVGGFGIRYIGS